MENIEGIIKLAQEGDRDALGVIYELFVDDLYKFIRYKVDINETAEDITSEAFLKAFEKIKSFKGKSSFKSWLYTIGKNLVIDWYKRHKYEPYDPKILENIKQEEPSKVQSSELTEQLFKMREILKNLQPNYREVLECRFLSNLSIKETAEALKISAANVKVIQNRAIKSAKLQIKK